MAFIIFHLWWILKSIILLFIGAKPLGDDYCSDIVVTVRFQDSSQRRLPVLARAAGLDAQQEEGELGRLRPRGRTLHQEHCRSVWRIRVRAAKN